MIDCLRIDSVLVSHSQITFTKAIWLRETNSVYNQYASSISVSSICERGGLFGEGCSVVLVCTHVLFWSRLCVYACNVSLTHPSILSSPSSPPFLFSLLSSPHPPSSHQLCNESLLQQCQCLCGRVWPPVLPHHIHLHRCVAATGTLISCGACSTGGLSTHWRVW